MFKDLVKVENNNVVTSSLKVAEVFEKRHADVLEAIENMKTGNSVLMNMFYETTYKTERNRKSYKMYLMNRDAFSLLVMGFTGKKAMDWKLKYIEAFNQMEKQLKAQPLTELEILSKSVQILQQQQSEINMLKQETKKHDSKFEEQDNKIEKQDSKIEEQDSKIDALNNVNIENNQRKQLVNIVNKYACEKGITFRKAWHDFDKAFNNAFDTNINLLRTNYAKKNNLDNVTRPEFLDATNRINDAIRVAIKLK